MASKFVSRSEYAKKLLDPRWQKLRLETLEASGWSCACCNSGIEDEKTLHVHHRQYFKGREPWEYDVGQLEVLCVECHSDRHEEEDALLLVCSFIDSDRNYGRNFFASMIAGMTGVMPDQMFRTDHVGYSIGRIAYEIPTPGICASTPEGLARIAEAAQRHPAAMYAALMTFADDELGSTK